MSRSMTKLFPAQRSVAMPPRSGLTLLEVIFAMMVLLVGLVSVGLLIPLAGRQAADSYQITQGLAIGESAIRMMSEQHGFQPSRDRPWCVVDAGNPLSMASFDEFSVSAAVQLETELNPGNPNSPLVNNKNTAALIQNAVIGEGFCLDPLFWGSQSFTYAAPTPVLDRELFPFWKNDIEPVTFSIMTEPVPRLRRVSFLNVNGITPVKYWIPQPAAVRVATMFGGDLVQAASATNRASPPTKGVYLSNTGSIVSSPSAPQNPTWIATVVPAETTTVIPTNAIEQVPGFLLWSVAPVQGPKLFDITVAIFSKRDPGEINTSAFKTDWQNNLPSSERAMSVTYIAPEAINSGSFEIELNSYSVADGRNRIKVGSWLMMSRMSYRDLLPSTGAAFSRPIHRWYRVVAVEKDGFPVRVRVVGKPWGPTQGEVNDFRENGRVYRLFPQPMPPLATPIPVQAVVLQDVIQVYEQQIAID
ncbi:MAG: hypothetical protein ACK5AC_03820 [Planctomycetota bacterium]